MCVYDTLATGLSDLFPHLSKIKKKLYTDEAQYLYVFVTKPQVASCFPVSLDLHAEREFFITGSASKSPTDHSHCKNIHR